MQHRLIIVGGGIVGTLHAWYAVKAGWMVTQLEADDEPRMGSVRGTGLISVNTFDRGDLAQFVAESFQLWRDIGDEIFEFPIRIISSLKVAVSESQNTALLSHIDLEKYGQSIVRYRQGDRLLELGPWLGEHVVAGLSCEADGVVDVAVGLALLRTELRKNANYSYFPNVRALDIGSGGVMDQYGERYFGDQILLATGTEQSLYSADSSARRLLSTSTAMMIQTRPLQEPLAIAITGLADTDVSIVPQFDGSIIVGAAIDTTGAHLFAIEDARCKSMMGAASRILGRPLPHIARRWLTRYVSSSDNSPGLVRETMPGVVVVTGLGWNGLTTAPGLAQQTVRGFGDSHYDFGFEDEEVVLREVDEVDLRL